MSDPHIGFYAHYHGRGHKHRIESILEHVHYPATVITSRLQSLEWRTGTLTRVVGIACDVDEVSQPGIKFAGDVPSLHYAPLWCANITHRVAEYTAWLDQVRPDLMVIDVSAEISMLTRLASVPQVVVRQHGDRSDRAHEDAYHAAHSLLAPFPRCMEDEITPDWVKQKTVYLNGFCRDGSSDASAVRFTKPTIAVMFGRGGSDDFRPQLRAAARRVRRFDWLVLGLEDDEHAYRTPENLKFAGWIDAPQRYLIHADLVITAAGHNSVMEVGNLRKRFIAIAERRPFDEQVRKAIVLEREKLAVGLTTWPDAGSWSELIDRCETLDPDRWDDIFADNGGRQAANYLQSVADWSRSERNCQSDHQREQALCELVC